MKKNSLIVIAIIAIVIIAATAAGTFMYYQGQNAPSPSPTPTSSPIPTVSPSELPMTLTDDTGATVTLTEYPERIVSLAPGNTQILFAIGAGDKVVAVTDYDNYPHNFTEWIAAGNMSSIGSYFNPAVEPIVALDPDLVLASLGSTDAAAQLRDLGYKVITLNPPNLDGILDNVLLVGKATNHTAEATSLVNSLQQRINAIADKLSNATTTPKVYVEIYSEPYMSVGKDTFIDGLIKLAGGQNIFENATIDYPEVSSEAIIAQNPDVIIFPTSMGEDLSQSFAGVANREGWSAITAIKNNALYIVDADALNQPGPRQVDALEALSQIIHPEIFGEYTNQP